MASRAVSTGDKPAQGTTQHNNNSWSSINGYPQTTMASYSHSDNTYMPPIASDLDPSQQTQQHKLQQQHPPLTMRHATHHHHQLPQLHMHSVPTHPTWPSMLTNPGGLAASPPTIHYPPHNGPNRLPLPPLKAKLRNKSGRTGPRKTLTDDDRRRMCEYATANPGVKQSDIGSIFGVERRCVHSFNITFFLYPFRYCKTWGLTINQKHRVQGLAQQRKVFCQGQAVREQKEQKQVS